MNELEGEAGDNAENDVPTDPKTHGRKLPGATIVATLLILGIMVQAADSVLRTMSGAHVTLEVASGTWAGRMTMDTMETQTLTTRKRRPVT